MLNDLLTICRHQAGDPNCGSHPSNIAERERKDYERLELQNKKNAELRKKSAGKIG